MRLSEEERATNRAAFKRMRPAEKADYIFTYFKLPLVLILIVVVALGTALVRTLTHKDPVLYVAFTNVVAPPQVEQALTTDYVTSIGEDPGRKEVVSYRELYLTKQTTLADHEYAYASRLKVMASVDGDQLDVVFMNDESFDILSESGYLLDLEQYFEGDEVLRENRVIESSNEVEVNLGEADELEEVTHPTRSALEVTDSKLLDHFSGSESISLGIIANTERKDQALDYLAYVEGRD